MDERHKSEGAAPPISCAGFPRPVDDKKDPGRDVDREQNCQRGKRRQADEGNPRQHGFQRRQPVENRRLDKI